MRRLRSLAGAVLLSALPATGGEPPVNLALATGPAEAPAGPGETLAAGAGVTGFVVSEPDQGGVDLNGDGDARDFVLHFRRAADGSVANTGLAVHATDVTDPAAALYASAELAADVDAASAPYLVFRVSEEAQGRTRLNGDPNREDFVAHVLDATSGVVRNLGVAVRFASTLAGQHALLAVFEADQGSDLNGDGDLLDLVLHSYDFAAQTLRNLGLAVGGVAAFDPFPTISSGPPMPRARAGLRSACPRRSRARPT